jgi:hypothetical protein
VGTTQAAVNARTRRGERPPWANKHDRSNKRNTGRPPKVGKSTEQTDNATSELANKAKQNMANEATHGPSGATRPANGTS